MVVSTKKGADMLIKDTINYTDTYTGDWFDSDDVYDVKKQIKTTILASPSAKSFSFSASVGFDTIFASLGMLVLDWKKESLEIAFDIVAVRDENDVVTIDSIALKYLKL